MLNDIQIIERSGSVSWEDIRQCLYDAHAVNRAKGINMDLYRKSAEELRKYVVEANGIMLVAMDENKVIGVGGLCEQTRKVWFAKETYAMVCLVGVLSEYSGRGIFTRLLRILEQKAAERSYSLIITSTHEKNERKINISKKNGYRLIGYVRSGDHYNVTLAKWLGICPYSKLYCKLHFYISWVKAHAITLLIRLKGFPKKNRYKA